MSILTWARYWLERAVQRGSLYLVIVLLLALAVLALGGASLAFMLPGAPHNTFSEALWWSILRLSDPGYLSDDGPSWWQRVLSATLSVLGMAVTVGGLVAIATQAMHITLNRMAGATTPVPFRGHLVVIGESDRLPRLLERVLALTKHRVVLLWERAGTEQLQAVARWCPRARDLERVVLRSGRSHRRAELDRAGCRHARAIVIPASEHAVTGGLEGPILLKTLLAIRSLLEAYPSEEPPAVVVELVDRRMMGLVRAALPSATVFGSDRSLARVMRWSLQSAELLDLALDITRPNEGMRVHRAWEPWMEGFEVGRLAGRIQEASFLGALVGQPPTRLTTDPNYVCRREDRLLVLSAGSSSFSHDSRDGLPADAEVTDVPGVEIVPSPAMKILVLGWNEAAPDLIAELALEPAGRYEVDILSTRPVQEVKDELAFGTSSVPLRIREGDPVRVSTNPQFELKSYERYVVLADRGVTPEASDLKTIALSTLLEQHVGPPTDSLQVIAEMLLAENVGVLSSSTVILSPQLAGDVLSALALEHAQGASMEELQTFQGFFAPRVVSIRTTQQLSERELARGLLGRGYCLIRVLAQTQPNVTRAVVCEPACSLTTNAGPD